MLGTSLGRYRLLGELGRGGMGVVYKAEDTRLGRNVALKLLPDELRADPQLLERFYREARAASALNHPSICVVYDVGDEEGRSFIAMELLEGATLRQFTHGQPMEIGHVLRYGVQIADGLDAAHARHVLHRDINPANIFITTRGTAKILDFGLAKVLPPDGLRGGVTRTGIPEMTHAGTLLGTVPYMSPEQVRGRPLDARSDLFSFGVMLYEMSTGQPPFEGPTTGAIFDNILHRRPVAPCELNPAVPPDLQRVILRAIEKDPKRRYQNAAAIRAELQALERTVPWRHDPIPPDAPTRPVVRRPRESTQRRRSSALGTSARLKAIDSVAVLPFVNSGADPDSEYLGDGLTESIIYKLSGLAALRVVPRTTVFRYRNRDDLQAIARELKVRAVVTGRVSLRAGTLVVQAELLDAARDAQLWGERYARQFADVFAVQEEIATAISASLQLRVSGEDRLRLAGRPTQDSEAYHEYLKGRYCWNQRTLAGLTQATVHFQQAIDRDPNFRLAYAGLADTFNVLGYYNHQRPNDVFPRAKAAAMRALEIDPHQGEAHASLGFATLFYDRDWEASERHFTTALSYTPSYASAHQWYGWFLLVMGRFDEMVAAMRRALERDPLSLIINDHLGYALSLAGRHDEAVTQLRRTLDLDHRFSLSHLGLGLEHRLAGRTDEALGEIELAVELSEGKTGLGYLGQTYGMIGRAGAAQQVLTKLDAGRDGRYVSALDRALVHDGFGDPDPVFASLEEALEDRVSDLIRFCVLPWTKATRLDARFESFAERLGLPAPGQRPVLEPAGRSTPATPIVTSPRH